MYVVWLDELACQDTQLAGGKAANLSRLAASHPVPPGFCITTAAYEAWSSAAHDAAEIIPPLQEAVATAYATLAARTQLEAPRVAVRSSVIGEDSHNASFAGQYETYLNVVGTDAVAASIVRCWRAARADRVQTYGRQHRLATADASPAVLVQALVPADVSFVAFSANPVTGDGTEVVVNANWGLGESVVSGTVTPDTYTIQKTTWTLTHRMLAHKQRMTISSAGGIRAVKTPRPMRHKPALTDVQLCEIARLATKLEDEMGWPVDIEGAYRGAILYLLQCRPISTSVQCDSEHSGICPCG